VLRQFRGILGRNWDKNFKTFAPHCNENSIYVFTEKDLRGLSANIYVHVSVSDLYIPMGSVHIFPAAEWVDRL